MRAILITLAAALVIAGCGGDSEDETTAASPPTTQEQATTDEQPTTTAAPTQTGPNVLDCGDARERLIEGITAREIPCPAAIAVAEAWVAEVEAGTDPNSEIGVLETSCQGLGDVSRLRVVCTSTQDPATEVSFFSSP